MADPERVKAVAERAKARADALLARLDLDDEERCLADHLQHLIFKDPLIAKVGNLPSRDRLRLMGAALAVLLDVVEGFRKDAEEGGPGHD